MERESAANTASGGQGKSSISLLAEKEYLKGYRWPSSRFTTEDMARLCELRHLTGKPITVVLQNAIRCYWDLVTLMHRDSEKPESQRGDPGNKEARSFQASTGKTLIE